MMNGSISRSNSFVNSIIRKFERQESSESPVPVRRKPGSQRGVPIQKSASASGIVESGRGFKPSDRYDLSKREFLTALSEKIWHVSSVSKPVETNLSVFLVVDRFDVSYHGEHYRMTPSLSLSLSTDYHLNPGLIERLFFVNCQSEVSDFLSSDHLPVLNVTVVSPRVATWSFYCDIWNLTTVG